MENRSGISIDSETDEMKELFERCYEAYPDKLIDKNQIKLIVQENNIMPYINWGEQSGITKFSLKLHKFIGRILSDIKMEVREKPIRKADWKYTFSKKGGEIQKKWSF